VDSSRSTGLLAAVGGRRGAAAAPEELVHLVPRRSRGRTSRSAGTSRDDSEISAGYAGISTSLAGRDIASNRPARRSAAFVVEAALIVITSAVILVEPAVILVRSAARTRRSAVISRRSNATAFPAAGLTLASKGIAFTADRRAVTADPRAVTADRIAFPAARRIMASSLIERGDAVRVRAFDRIRMPSAGMTMPDDVKTIIEGAKARRAAVKGIEADRPILAAAMKACPSNLLDASDAVKEIRFDLKACAWAVTDFPAALKVGAFDRRAFIVDGREITASRRRMASDRTHLTADPTSLTADFTGCRMQVLDFPAQRSRASLASSRRRAKSRFVMLGDSVSFEPRERVAPRGAQVVQVHDQRPHSDAVLDAHADVARR
jgi:hypothetical protein